MNVFFGYLYQALAIVLVFGLAVFVHEFGHMFFALIRGVGVESFAIGMGPKICAWHWKGIEFSFRWIPVGGFVKLAGLMPGEEPEQDGPQTRAFALAEQTNSVELGHDPDGLPSKAEPSLAESSYDDLMALSNKGLLTKILVFSGGVFMNFVTAIVATVLLLMLSHKAVDIPIKIWRVDADSPAALAGLKAGDQVVAVNGSKVRIPNEFDKAVDDLLKTAHESGATEDQLSSFALTLTLLRSEEGTSRTVQSAELSVGRYYRAVQLEMPPIIGKVNVGLPADKAGLKGGDRIVSVDGGAGHLFQSGARDDRSQRGEGNPARIPAQRGAPLGNARSNRRSHHFLEGLIGVEIGADKYVSVPGADFVEAAFAAPQVTYKGLASLVAINVNFFKKATLKQVGEGLGGPVMIARMTARAAGMGLPDLVSFFVTLNLLLMVFNLLPLPVLDGGFILISIVESVIRRPVPPRVLGPIYTAFVIFFMSLMALITLWDIKKIF